MQPLFRQHALQITRRPIYRRLVNQVSSQPEPASNLGETPYVHIGDCVILRGKHSIMKPSPSSVFIESKSPRRPSYRNISTSYIFDRYVAKKIAALILPHHGSPKNLFIEINPGIGCVTAELLNHGLESINLIESNQNFIEYLNAYRKFSEHVTVSTQRFSYFGDAVSMSSLWVNSLPPNKIWQSDAGVSVFSIIPPRQERFMIPWLVNMISNWHQYGRFKYFLVISDRLLWRCTNPEIATSGNFKHYTVGHILASTLFDITPIAKIPKSDFVPPISLSHVEQNSKGKKIAQFEPNFMALAAIEPKRYLDTSLNLAECALYAAFVRQLTARRHARIIPTCERLLPGIGLALLDIPEITSPSTRIGDLKPANFLQIFRMMRKSPDFVPELFLPTSNPQMLPQSEVSRKEEPIIPNQSQAPTRSLDFQINTHYAEETEWADSHGPCSNTDVEDDEPYEHLNALL